MSIDQIHSHPNYHITDGSEKEFPPQPLWDTSTDEGLFEIYRELEGKPSTPNFLG